MKRLCKVHENATDFVTIKILSQFSIKLIETRAYQDYSYNVFYMLKQNSKEISV